MELALVSLMHFISESGALARNYRYHFNRWLAADASYGYGGDTQQNFTSSGPLSVKCLPRSPWTVPAPTLRIR